MHKKNTLKDKPKGCNILKHERRCLEHQNNPDLEIVCDCVYCTCLHTADRLVFLYALFFLIMFPINVYFLSINSYLFINKPNIHLKHKIKKREKHFSVRKTNNKDRETSRIMMVVEAVVCVCGCVQIIA